MIKQRISKNDANCLEVAIGGLPTSPWSSARAVSNTPQPGSFIRERCDKKKHKKKLTNVSLYVCMSAENSEMLVFLCFFTQLIHTQLLLKDFFASHSIACIYRKFSLLNTVFSLSDGVPYCVKVP